MRRDTRSGLPRGGRQGSSTLLTLATLATFALTLPAAASASAGPRDYEGPQDIGPEAPPAEDGGVDGGAVVPVSPGGGEGGVAVPDAGGDEGGDDGFAVEDDSGDSGDDGFAVEDDGDGDDGENCEDGFCFEDLTEDEEALAKELEVPKVAVKGPTGTVKGTIKDSTDGSPLIGAKVTANGTKYATKTDVDGNFELPLPPGTYEIKVWYDAYEGVSIVGVGVEADKSETINRELAPIAGMAQTVLVEEEINTESAAGKLVERKKATSTRDFMSQDDIKKSGGGATSAVARRIVSATIVDGRYLFVRGLGHRYGNTLFDGARVPSPDPNRRSVPLDIFPSGAFSAINVQKTATPDVPADFAGGSVQLESRQPPEEFSASVYAKLGVNTATIGQQGLKGDRFAGDGVAFGNIGRSLPALFDTDTRINRNEQDESLNRIWTNDQIERFGEAMPSTKTSIRPHVGMPNFSAGGSIGTTFNPWGTELGFMAAAQYSNSQQTLRETIRIYGGTADGQVADDEFVDLDTATPRVDYQGLQTVFNTAWSGLTLLKWKLSRNHRLDLSGFYTRDADLQVRQLDGLARSTNQETPVRNIRMRYQMRSIAFARLGGKHEFPGAKGLKFDWFGSFAQASLDDPLLRDVLFRQEPDGYRVDDTEAIRFQFFKLVDNTATGAANFTMPFKQWGQLDSAFKFGGWVEGKQRNFATRSFEYAVQDDFRETRPAGTGDILNPMTIGGGANMASGGTEPFFIREFTRAKDSYNASQSIYAGYAMIDLPLVRWMRVVGGARFEASDIKVRPYDRFGRPVDPEDNGNVVDRDILPSLSMIFPVGNDRTGDMNIRLSGAKTLARPEFRELAPFIFTDFAGGFNVFGNPNLRSTKVWNADLRWEWFPSANEVIAVSAFYKFFDAPIERVIANSSSPLQSYRNARSAQNIGGELELRKNLEFVHRGLRDVSIGANFAYIHSRVQYPTEKALDGFDFSGPPRPMEGQSPFVVNTYLAYDNDEIGTNIRLLYNTFGRRIAFVGGQGLPHIYELPVHSVDLTYLQRLYKGLGLSVGAYNLLNWRRRFVQGENDSITYNTLYGLTFAVGLRYDI
jgi:TonB-dependent receptor